jgi:hypothetical protein
MAERRLLDLVTERLTLGRRMRILRHRTARWFLPPVRQSANDPLTELPRLRLLPTPPAARRNEPTTH